MADTVAETQRLRLRTWDEDDADRFYAIMNTPSVMRFLGGVQAPDAWRAAFDRLMTYQRELGFTFWIVERLADREMLGFCGLKRVNYDGAPNAGEVEIGWRLRDSAWGQGIAKEAAIATLDLGFTRFAAPSIVAVTTLHNRASWGLMERLGMVRDPALDYDDPRLPALNPMRQWRLLPEAWTSR